MKNKFIEFKNVKKTYVVGEQKFNALNGINLDMNQGEFVVVLGPSGAGKSTLLNLLGGMDNMLSMMKSMIWLIIGIAIFLGAIIIYNLGILSYSEKQYQFATLKVLGFDNKKIRNIFIKQNNWIAVVSIILGLPFGYYLTDYLFKYAIEEHYDFRAFITIRTFIIAAIGTYLVSYIVSIILSRKIKKIDMVSSLKGNE